MPHSENGFSQEAAIASTSLIITNLAIFIHEVRVVVYVPLSDFVKKRNGKLKFEEDFEDNTKECLIFKW